MIAMFTLSLFAVPPLTGVPVADRHESLEITLGAGGNS